MKRIEAIDFTRGLVMIIMALDHTRDLFHVDSLVQSPTDLATTTPFLFFTRWITHLCAPVFVFLAGVSVWLSGRAQGNLVASRRFLWSRGLWLVFLECTVVSFGIWFDLKFRTTLFQVIGTIGISFLVLGCLLKVPPRLIGLLGLLIVLGHNALPLQNWAQGPPWQQALTVLFSAQPFQLTPDHLLFLAYPPVPWLGIMLLGFAAGPLFELAPQARRRLFLYSGAALLVLFGVLRFSNLYGDPAPWSPQKSALFTFLSFLNTTKYPPSLLYSAMTLGLMGLILAVAEGMRNKFSRVVSLYGKVPLFYYLVHWYVLHTLLLVLLLVQGFSWSDLDFGPFRFGRPMQENGLPLWGVYLVWASVVLALYPLCRWYAGYRARHPEKRWLRYF
ncbi:MAG: DUF1624 domain-containing protein [Adhaeribacter sp.]